MNFPKQLIPLFLLLLASSLVFAQDSQWPQAQIPQQEQTLIASSINEISLDARCTQFWKDTSWEQRSPYVITGGHFSHFIIGQILEQLNLLKLNPSKEPLYRTPLQQTLLSTEIDEWDSASAQRGATFLKAKYPQAAKSLDAAYENALLAKADFKDATNKSDAFLKVYMTKREIFEQLISSAADIEITLYSYHPLSEDVNKEELTQEVTSLLYNSSAFREDDLWMELALFSYALPAIAQNSPDAISYGKSWKSTLAHEFDAMQGAQGAASIIFESAQKNASFLEHMGVAHPAYHGGALPAYQKWQDFLTLSSRKINAGSPPPNPQTLDEKYAFSFLSLRQMRSYCLNPQDLPLFSKGANLSKTFNLLSSADEGEIIFGAMEFDSSLAKAKAIMQGELENASYAAKAQKQENRAMAAFLEKNNPEKFALYDEFTYSPKPYEGPSMVSGTIPDLYSLFSDFSSLANTSYSRASSQMKDDSGQNYAAIAIHNFKNSSYYFSLADLSAIELNKSMVQRRDDACASAKEKLDSLKANLLQKEASASGVSLAISHASDLFFDANKTFQETKYELSIGNQYELCMQSAHYSSLAQDALNSPSSLVEDAQVSRALLTYEMLVNAGKKMGEDVFAYEASLASFKKLQKIGGSALLDEINLQISSIHSLLNSRLSSQNEKYILLSSYAHALEEESPSASAQFYSKFSKLRKEGMWSHDAIKEFEQLDSLLLAQETILKKKIFSAINSSICDNAAWAPSSLSPLAANSFANMGGRWQSKNKILADFDENVQISCPFPIPFNPKDITASSGNIENAYSANKEIKISLSQAHAYENAWVEFEKEGIAFSASKNSCMLEINEYGKMLLSANYSLAYLFEPAFASINIPWGEGRSFDGGTLTLSTGKSFEPISPFISNATFILSEINGANSASAYIWADNYLLQKKNLSITPLEASEKLQISYFLAIDSLPQCEKAQIAIFEEGRGKLENLQIESNESAASFAGAKYSGKTSWAFSLSPVPKGGSTLLFVKYETSEPAKWMEATLYILRSQAYEYSDEGALEMADMAQKAFSAGQREEAYVIIENLQKRLSSHYIDNGKSMQAWEKEYAQGKIILQQLQNLSQASSSSLWKASIPKWIERLSSSLSDANSLAQEGQMQQAREKYAKTLLSIKEEAAKEAQKDYTQLYSMHLRVLESSSVKGAPELPPSYSNAQNALEYASLSLSSSQSLQSLPSLATAGEGIREAHSSSLLFASQKFAEQNEEYLTYLQNAQNLSSSLGAYLQSLATLDSAGTHFTQGTLSKKEAQDMQKALQKPISGWEDEMPRDLEKTLTLILQRQRLLEDADAQLEIYKNQVQQAPSSLEDSAKNLYRTAYLSLEDLKKKQPGSPSIPTLSADLDSLAILIKDKNWAEAIVMGESIIKRADASSPAQEGKLPLEMIFITLLFVAAAAYVLLFPKPPKKQEPTPVKILPKESQPAAPQ
ncbi:hypothetical protein COU37_02315 [Candidatus Micrarchaeota archaeon CG10_big_fil_rev_8_21_14_0_10_45_29]|nr:MAG: hypothetical protein COU37_02315 [Candidatus Micrarchaeota archaeon CG10_big_fil_rev_8_21_14_0_10_45_29]